MRVRALLVAAVPPLAMTGAFTLGGIAVPTSASAALVQDVGDDPAQILVSRLTLDDYKTTVKGLTRCRRI